jgi:lactoylglutathione lyase
MSGMKLQNLISTLSILAILVCCAPLRAQTLALDSVHLIVPDTSKAVQWYIQYMGGAKTRAANEVAFGPTVFMFQQANDALPSAGSVIDHVGFSFPDLDMKIAEWQAAGIKILTPVREIPGLFKLGFIEDPWGVKIEVVQDPETLGFHHIHLRSTDPEAMFKWLSDLFGGEKTKLMGRLDGLKFGNVWVLVQKANEEPTPSAGHAIDHIGWRTASLETAAAELKKKGAKFTTEPTTAGQLKVSFVEGPAALRVEVLQHP